MPGEPREGISQVAAKAAVEEKTRESRRDFLKQSLGVLSYTGLRRFFREDIPEVREKGLISPNAPLQSPYFWAALDKVRTKHPDQEEAVKGILEKTDQEGFSNLTTFSPSYDSNLKVPITKVSVNNILGEESKTAENGKEKVIYIVFSALAIPPAGHPFTAWDIVMDRVFSSIPGVEKLNKDVDIYSVGFAQGLGGEVSEEYIKQTRAGTEAYGALYGELIKKILAENPDAKVVLQAISVGCSIAELASRQFNESELQRVNLLLDNPASDHPKNLRDLQATMGFLLESASRMMFDPKIRAEMEAEDSVFNKKYRELLDSKGIDWRDDKEQSNLKLWAVLTDVAHHSFGMPLDTLRKRLYIRQAIFDPLSFPKKVFWESIPKFFSKNKTVAIKRDKSSEYAIGGTHLIERFRVDKWCRILRNYVK